MHRSEQRRARMRGHNPQLKTETEEERAQRLRKERERRARQRAESAQSGALVVYPFHEWCVLRGLSVPQGRRLIDSGRLKVTQLSERRIGIRSDHDREYLDSCLRDSA
jgi:hypothetical protein